MEIEVIKIAMGRMTILGGTMVDEIEQDKASLVGIKGWLALLAIGLVNNSFIIAYSVFEIVREIAAVGVSSIVQSAGAIIVIASFLILVTTQFFALKSLYQKSSYFPKAITWLYVAATIQSFMALTVVPATNALGVEIAKIVVSAAIWLPYVWRSKRVAATMIN